MEESDFEITTLSAHTTIGYSSKPATFSPFSWRTASVGEWAGFYLAETLEHARRYQDVETNSSVYKVSLRQSVKMITCKNKIMASASRSSVEKALLMKIALRRLYPELQYGFLIEQMGYLGLIYKGYEVDEDFEIAIPNHKVLQWIYLEKIN